MASARRESPAAENFPEAPDSVGRFPPGLTPTSGHGSPNNHWPGPVPVGLLSEHVIQVPTKPLTPGPLTPGPLPVLEGKASEYEKVAPQLSNQDQVSTRELPLLAVFDDDDDDDDYYEEDYEEEDEDEDNEKEADALSSDLPAFIKLNQALWQTESSQAGLSSTAEAAVSDTTYLPSASLPHGQSLQYQSDMQSKQAPKRGLGLFLPYGRSTSFGDHSTMVVQS
mmetsp:Transcript_29211/g.52992  ORF Transcript_29211/g.52992 Transcript_29211/m.52992 type:complete len:224 (-) Transcript_29211:396-1067(-)